MPQPAQHKAWSRQVCLAGLTTVAQCACRYVCKHECSGAKPSLLMYAVPTFFMSFLAFLIDR